MLACSCPRIVQRQRCPTAIGLGVDIAIMEFAVLACECTCVWQLCVLVSAYRGMLEGFLSAGPALKPEV